MNRSKPDEAASRRAFLKKSAGIASGSAAALLAGGSIIQAQQPSGRATSALLERANADPRRRLLLHGATIVSMDPVVGNLPRGDLLIEGTTIKDVGQDLASAGRDGRALTIDLTNTIVIPGFVDPHIHAWQGQLARLIPNSNGVADDRRHNYFSVMHQTLGPQYRPEDMYVGNLVTALSCLDAGITCFCDNSHNSRSSDHADAAVRALIDSGGRAVYAGGGIRFPDDQLWARQWPEDLRRLKRQFFMSDDQLVTFRMLLVGTVNPEVARIARELDLWISWDGGAANPQLPQLYAEGLLVGRESFNHGTGVPEGNWRVIREHGAKINVCPRSDSQFTFGGAGKGYNGVQDVLDHGIRPGISNDNPSAYAIDMFAEMQVLYFTQRSLAQLSRFNRETAPPAPVTARDVLEFATVRGAECCGVDHICGSVTPGKAADLNVIRTDTFRQYPVNNAIGSIVQAGTLGSLDAVFVAGRAKKWNGQMTSALAGHDLARLRKRIDDSRQYLLSKAGWDFDLFGD